MYHLPYSYIHNQSKIKLLILPSFQASTWCSWELHSFGILSFITGCLLPKILRPCSGLVFKVLWSNRPLDHWPMTMKSLQSQNAGQQTPSDRAQYPRRKWLSKLLILTFYSRIKDEVRCFICQKTKPKSKALSYTPNST